VTKEVKSICYICGKEIIIPEETLKFLAKNKMIFPAISCDDCKIEEDDHEHQ
jgi:hypothetical protein